MPQCGQSYERLAMSESQEMVAACSELYQRRISTMSTDQAMKQLLIDFRSGSDQFKEALFASVVLAHAVSTARGAM